MTNLSNKRKLEIANSGGLYDETSANSWIGTPIRKGKKMGSVVRDQNGRQRILTVKFEKGYKERIKLNYIGADHPSVHKYEYKMGGDWHRF